LSEFVRPKSLNQSTHRPV